MKRSFYELTFYELVKTLKKNNLNESGAKLLFNWHYKQKRTSPCVTDLAKETRKYLLDNFDFVLPKIDQIFESSDKTVKFLFKLHDGCYVETVLIPFKNRYSICLSSQVGCAMKCSFCFTGTQGYKRNLKTSEIVGQYLEVYRWLEANRLNDGKILNMFCRFCNNNSMNSRVCNTNDNYK